MAMALSTPLKLETGFPSQMVGLDYHEPLHLSQETQLSRTGLDGYYTIPWPESNTIFLQVQRPILKSSTPGSDCSQNSTSKNREHPSAVSWLCRVFVASSRATQGTSSNIKTLHCIHRSDSPRYCLTISIPNFGRATQRLSRPSRKH
jgi:hypothetical protein